MSGFLELYIQNRDAGEAKEGREISSSFSHYDFASRDVHIQANTIFTLLGLVISYRSCIEILAERKSKSV